MILETTWQTPSGLVVVSDFLAMRQRDDAPMDSPKQRERRGDSSAQHLLVRTAVCQSGDVEMAAWCDPSYDFGRVDACWEYLDTDWYVAASINSGFGRLRVSSDAHLDINGRSVHGRRRLSVGETTFVALGWSDVAVPISMTEIDELQRATNRYWSGWLSSGNIPDHPWRELLGRSALTLKGLTYASTGAVLAAPTTSLPEHVGGSRNWDYRFSWIRDSTYALGALRSLGYSNETADYLAFLDDVLRSNAASQNANGGARIGWEVLYDVDGSTSPPEVVLDHLSGYRSSRPVRAGNGAHGQKQFDIWGAIVDCVFQSAGSKSLLSERTWRLVVGAVEDARSSWREKDRGIWEVRGEEQHFTFSKVMCWVAVQRGAQLAQMRGDLRRSEEWSQVAREIHAEVCERALRTDGCFVQSYGSTNLDASLLLLSSLGFLPATDERVRRTVLAVADQLADGPYVARYQPATTDDGFEGEPEGSFTICSFWLVTALAQIGEIDRARAHCELLIDNASPLGLYAEEMDPSTGQQLGNYPQAFSHLAHIAALLSVIEAERATGGS
jgi:GH15 family glucan-1,4-alpha-glucosidase